MLPDYPEIKKKIFDVYTARVNNIIKYSSFGSFVKHTIFEGHKNRIIRHDGTVDDTEFKELASNISIDLKNFEDMSVEDIMKKVDECAFEMAKQQLHHFVKVIENTVNSVGNTVKCDGEPFQPKHFFDMLEKVEISFNKDNAPNLPTFVAATDTLNIVAEVLKMIKDTPELKEKMDNILKKKRSEWRDRESSRKLVG